jgi:predicted transcriptional regulator
MSKNSIEIVTKITMINNEQLTTDIITTKAESDTGISKKTVEATIVGHCETQLKQLGLGVSGFRDH